MNMAPKWFKCAAIFQFHPNNGWMRGRIMTDGDCLIVTTACVGEEPRQPSDQHHIHGGFMDWTYSGKNLIIPILWSRYYTCSKNNKYQLDIGLGSDIKILEFVLAVSHGVDGDGAGCSGRVGAIMYSVTEPPPWILHFTCVSQCIQIIDWIGYSPTVPPCHPPISGVSFRSHFLVFHVSPHVLYSSGFLEGGTFPWSKQHGGLCLKATTPLSQQYLYIYLPMQLHMN